MKKYKIVRIISDKTYKVHNAKKGIWNLILLKVSVFIPLFTFPRPFVSSKLRKKERVGLIFLKKEKKKSHVR